jgi:hypothetical protein
MVYTASYIYNWNIPTLCGTRQYIYKYIAYYMYNYVATYMWNIPTYVMKPVFLITTHGSDFFMHIQ